MPFYSKKATVKLGMKTTQRPFQIPNSE